jgi:glycosyltransferase involved in cell wall biosynthesis
MKVSVLIITYNHANFITQALDSVLMQKVNFDYEILISEDCSTDGTRDIIVEFHKKHPNRVRLLLSEHNLNNNEIIVRGIQAAQGQYIALLDGDDYWTSSHKLQNQADFLDNHRECAICFHAVTEFYENGDQEPRIFRGEKKISTLEDLLETNFIQTCSVMFRRGLFNTFPEWFYTSAIGDWELHILNAQHGKIGYIDEVMGVYRRHSGGVYTSSSRIHRLQSRIRMYKNVNSHLSFKYDEIVKAMLSKCCYDLIMEYEKNGDLANAKVCLVKCVIDQSVRRYIPSRSLFVTLLRLYAPMLHKLIKMLSSPVRSTTVC